MAFDPISGGHPLSAPSFPHDQSEAVQDLTSYEQVSSPIPQHNLPAPLPPSALNVYGLADSSYALGESEWVTADGEHSKNQPAPDLHAAHLFYERGAEVRPPSSIHLQNRLRRNIGYPESEAKQQVYHHFGIGLDDRIVMDSPQRQIIPLEGTARPPQNPGMGEPMQLLMLNQMMMQQMAVQQMQAAHLTAMAGRDPGHAGHDPCLARAGGGGSRTSISIQNCHKRRQKADYRLAALSDAAKIVAVAPPSIAADVSPSAFDNWQEATIILCVAIVGLIYLVSARSPPDVKQKPSLAARHMI